MSAARLEKGFGIRVISLAGLASAALLALLGADMWRSYDRAIGEALKETRNLVRALEEHTERTVYAVDDTLLRFARSQRLRDMLETRNRSELSALLHDRLGVLPQARWVSIVDADGISVASSMGDREFGTSYASQDCFVAARDGSASTGVSIGTPFTDPQTGDWFLPLSRRIDDENGRFLGIVLAAVDPQYFAGIYRSIDVGETGRVSLMRRDGLVVARWPDRSALVGRSAAAGALVRVYLPRADEGSIRLHTVLEDRDMLISYKAVGSTPLVVNVAFAVDDVVSAWRKSLVGYGICAAVILALIVLATLLVFRNRRREQAFIRERRAKERAQWKHEQADARARVKSAFLASMSHELRTPLNAIIGFCDMIRHGYAGPPNSPKYADYLRHIRESGQHLLELVNGLLDLARIEAGKMPLREEAVDLNTELGACAEIMSGMGAGDGQRVVVSTRVTEIMLRADPVRLREIFLNLYSNALKFSPPGSPVAVTSELRADGTVVISVADSGPGMTEREIQHVLEPWSQGDAAKASELPGSGLGLPLAREFVRIHGGTLRIESVIGRGTTIWVEFGPDRVLRAMLPAA